MNPITISTSSPSARGPEAGRPLSLAERVLGHHAQTGVLSTSVGAAAEAGQEQGDVIPLPKPIKGPMPDLAAIWAQQMFIELLMSGDEEETGVPPLSIDI